MTGTQGTLKCGTLAYTRRTLVTLFLWLLWGDFCFVCMEMVHPTVLPLTLKGLGASNIIISVYVTTVMNFMNFLVNPIVSFRSDRHRGRWGRRRPFLLFATPFVSLFMILTVFARPLGAWVKSTFLSGSAVTEATLAIGFLGIVVVGYQFFHMIVGSVYYYLFNDVVPETHLGRFLALFRAVGAGAGALYQFFAYRYAESHGNWIFAGVAVLYLVGFLAMTMMVKEGEYPPPPPNLQGKRGLWGSVRTFASECFCSSIVYWKFYAIDALVSASSAANVFVIFWFRSMGMTLEQFGRVMGIAQVISTVLLIPAGVLCDRKHPIRVVLLGLAIMTATTPIGFVFLGSGIPADVAVWLAVAYTAVQIPGMVIFQASVLPLFMRFLPHERYGQFSSANAMVRSIVMIGAGAAVGVMFDLLKRVFPENDYYYRFVPCWVFVFQILALGATYSLYRTWKRLGGETGYTPPPVRKPVNAEEGVC